MKAQDRVYLVGAGVSIDGPSAIMAAGHLLDVIFQWIAAGDPQSLARLRAAASANDHINPFVALRFEAVIQAITNVLQPPTDFLKWIQVLGRPNMTHRYLAYEIGQGATVFTVNFDNRIEDASQLLGVNPYRYVTSPSNRRPRSDARLIKLHGTFPRRGRSAPWATLGKIGEAGLGYERFPSLQRFVDQRCRDRHLIVLGYSASDSFDVVPLFERNARPRHLSWMDFSLGLDGLSANAFDLPDRCPIPNSPGSDFVEPFLSALQSHHPVMHVERVKAGSAVEFLRSIDADVVERSLIPVDRVEAEHTRIGNSELFEDVLKQFDLTDADRSDLLSILLDENIFGAHLDETFVRDDEDVESGDKIFAYGEKLIENAGIEAARELLRKTSSQPGDLVAERDRLAGLLACELRLENFADSFVLGCQLVDINSRMGMPTFRTVEMLQMHCEDHFEFAINRGLHALAECIVAELDALFRRSGHIIAAVQARLMHAKIVRSRMFLEDLTQHQQAEFLIGALSASESAVYYALRMGRGDVLDGAIFHLFHFLELGGRVGDALDLLRRYLNWLGANEVGRRTDALLNLGLLECRSGEIAAAAATFRSISRLGLQPRSARECLFHVLDGEIHRGKGDVEKARGALEKARIAWTAMHGLNARILDHHLSRLERAIR